ncbi:hypothetical protein ABZZ20_16645 [Streptomyces sp. NPDC006430]|uniref:hypothetical protein n=1 Tax=Streptomyces sp. NPDC006430 TaxID=3154299 RepID=UPI0033AF81A6
MPSSTHRGRSMAAVQLPLLVPLLVWLLLCIAAVAGFASAHASSGPAGPSLRAAFAAQAPQGPADLGGPFRGAGAGAGAGASARPSGAVQVLPAPDAGTTGTARADRVTVRAGLPDGGPSCDPGPAGPDRTPSAPARAGGHAEQGIPAASRSVLCGGGAPCAIPRALLCVRGPDRAAPGPVELSVMRV